VNQGHGEQTALAIVKGGGRSGIFYGICLHPEKRRHHEEVVFDAMVHFLEKDFLFEQRLAQAFVGALQEAFLVAHLTDQIAFAGKLGFQTQIEALRFGGPFFGLRQFFARGYEQKGWHEAKEERRCDKRRGGGKRFDEAIEVIKGLPQRDGGHDVGGAAAQYKDPEGYEHPMKRYVAAFADEMEKREGNTEVSESDKGIGDDVQPNQRRLPVHAIAMREEV